MASTVTKEELIVWLADDEAGSRLYRANRLHTLLEIFESPKEKTAFVGGSDSYQAYRELRLAFIHGLYFATVLLCFACIEQELAGSIHMKGSETAANATLKSLLPDALRGGVIDQKLHDAINELRSVRNAYAHFRAPTHRTSAVQRTLRESVLLDELSEHDAIGALRVLAGSLHVAASSARAVLFLSYTVLSNH